MDQYRVLGNPIAHSKSPQIQNRFAELTGQAMFYDRQLVALDGFAQALTQLRQDGIKGCNVTVPFKFEAFAAATQLSARAELAQAVNTLRFDADGIFADNTDGLGLVNDIERNAGVSLAGRDVLLVGAGGAAAGVLGPLIQAMPRRIVLTNRSIDKAEALAGRHRTHPSMAPLLQKTELDVRVLQGLEGDFDVMINATASSLAGQAIAVPASVLKPGALAYDLMYGPAVQPFLQRAASAGATGRDGLGMLVEQAAAAFEIWRGIRPSTAEVFSELRAALPTGA